MKEAREITKAYASHARTPAVGKGGREWRTVEGEAKTHFVEWGPLGGTATVGVCDVRTGTEEQWML